MCEMKALKSYVIIVRTQFRQILFLLFLRNTKNNNYYLVNYVD